ncbi:MAG: AbrB/MazE/SpoVT family DNA-binding domain-containing protein [Candidatus Nanoarchaeia archaeon]
MAINQEELKKLIEVNADIERISTISSDGKNLLTRIPKEVREFVLLKKGSRVKWLVDSNKKIMLEVLG